MFVNKTYLQLSISDDEKEFLKEKAKELGYKSVSAFVVDTAKSHFTIEVDMAVYKNLTREINYVGKNINSLIRRINTDGFYSDHDVDILLTNQKKIVELMNKEYGRLLNLKQKYTSDKLSLKEKENLMKALQQNEMEIPKKVVLEEVYEQIKDDCIYIGRAIEDSPKQEEEVVEYFWGYLYGETLFKLDENKLIEFADKIFFFTQKLKMKLMKLDNIFENKDWYELKDILDEYEIN